MHKIITTLGPASASVDTIIKMHDAGASSFRLNLSHLNKRSLIDYEDLFVGIPLYPSYTTDIKEYLQTDPHNRSGISYLNEKDLIEMTKRLHRAF